MTTQITFKCPKVSKQPIINYVLKQNHVCVWSCFSNKMIFWLWETRLSYQLLLPFLLGIRRHRMCRKYRLVDSFSAVYITLLISVFKVFCVCFLRMDFIEKWNSYQKINFAIRNEPRRLISCELRGKLVIN